MRQVAPEGMVFDPTEERTLIALGEGDTPTTVKGVYKRKGSGAPTVSPRPVARPTPPTEPQPPAAPDFFSVPTGRLPADSAAVAAEARQAEERRVQEAARIKEERRLAAKRRRKKRSKTNRDANIAAAKAVREQQAAGRTESIAQKIKRGGGFKEGGLMSKANK